MGSGVIANCKCGLEAEILIGGGMHNFTTTCYFPCLCERCHSVVQVNLLANTNQCPACNSPDTIPFDDPQLSKTAGRHVVAQWNVPELGKELTLTDGYYKCPRCRKMTLRFSPGGLLWD
jgi:Zn finger protein HypA/HybF involved in hydrogenase expression